MSTDSRDTGSTGQTSAIRSDIEKTRGDMSKTVNAIEERLSPAHLKEQFASVTAGITSDVEAKVADLKESVMGGYHEAKDHLKDDLGRELRDAKTLVTDEFTHARTAVRDATVGRVEHMVHDARESVTDAGTSILDTIKANPIPAALVGVGLGWLLFGRRSATSARSLRSGTYAYGGGYGYDEGGYQQRGGGGGDLLDQPRRVMRQGERAVGNAAHAASEGASRLGHRVQEGAGRLAHGAQELAHDATDRVAGVAGDARDRAMHLASDARERGMQLAQGAGRQVMRAERTVESTLRENPLAMGAVAVAIGAAIGLALPHSRVEDEWMGEAKERLFEQAQEYAGEAIHRAEDAVGQLAQGGGESGGQGGQKSGESSSSGGSNGGSNGGTESSSSGGSKKSSSSSAV
ncbi:MAG: hypothetical protein JWP97_688 [Labilithrix sp.]|nr:hypothetical protein [Labilithrix sp.]